MLFNSYGFLFVFLPLVLGVYWSLRPGDGRKWVLLLSSYVFYGVWSWKFAALMLATTSVDYFTAQWLHRSATPRGKRGWLVVSMVSNLGVLAAFKYFDFFARSVNAVAGEPLVGLLDLTLPIGISFYTFESMSYTIDVYRGRVQVLHRFLDYAHFVTMFPRLVAGPIVRYIDLEQQLKDAKPKLEAAVVVEALQFFVFGLLKKVVIADPIATKLVDPLFAQHGELGLVPAWTAALGYTAQLYFDFSGYSDMAMGLGLLVGLRLPRNFNLPYRASSISDFWRRWHISLSTWLRDYLYIPLGGNRHGTARTYLNLFLTMLLGGLWHGANWTFVVWGALHGAALMVDHATQARPKLPAGLGRLLTLLVVVVGWVVFRAESVGQAWTVYRGMLGLTGVDAAFARAHMPMLAFLGVALALSVAPDTSDVKLPVRRVVAVLMALAFAIAITRMSVPSPFLYFQF